MDDQSITEEKVGGVDEGSLLTIEQKLARGKDQANYKATQVDPEKVKLIEDQIKKGAPLTRIAADTHSSNSTVRTIRDRLLEREPSLFKSHMSGALQRIANKAAYTIERGLDNMEEQDIKPGQLTGLSVALGILLDKQAILNGDVPTTVVEHRLTIDTAAVNELIANSKCSDDDVIDVTHSMSAA